MIRVLVVDDSALMRRAITAMLESDPELSVVGAVGDGVAAIAQVAALRPDVVLLDVDMPVLDGLGATEQIMAYYPTPILVFSSAVQHAQTALSMHLLGAGALDVFPKPANDGVVTLAETQRELIRRVKLLSRVQTVTHLRGRRRGGDDALRPPAPAAPPVKQTPGSHPASFVPADQIVVIGASTGGPRVVQQILSALPADFAPAVVVVQHIAEGFAAGFAEWLAAACVLPVRLAETGQVAAQGNVIVARDDQHVLIDGSGVISTSREPPLLQCPSVDVAMQRAAASFGARTIGVLLTGMGRDGALGLQAIRQAGGATIAQSAASCTVWGMPRAALELGVVDEERAPDEIAARLVALARNRR